MDKFTRVDATKAQGGHELTMQLNLASPAALKFTKDTPLTYFKDTLVASGASKVQFFTINGAQIPLCERVQDLSSYPILLQIDGGARIFALNFSQEFRIAGREAHAIKDEEYYADFAQGVGLKGYASQFMPHFAHRFQQALPGKERLDRSDILQSLRTVVSSMGRLETEKQCFTHKQTIPYDRLD